MLRHHLIKVRVQVNSEFRGALFTGKVVKSLLIDGNPRLKQFFEKSSLAPKLIHVTPLYVENERGVRAIYSSTASGSSQRVDAASISLKGRYMFYVGFVEAEHALSPRFDDVYTALINLSGRHKFMNSILEVELLESMGIQLEECAKKSVKHLVEAGKIKIVLSSPTLLRDPFRRAKHKSLIPTVMNLFSTPVYVNLYLRGLFKSRNFLRILTILHRVLNEPWSIHRTVKLKWVKYEPGKESIPTLVGYVNLYLNRDYYERYSQRGANVEALLEETFLTALALGIGTSRAAGFGHITLSASPQRRLTTPSASRN